MNEERDPWTQRIVEFVEDLSICPGCGGNRKCIHRCTHAKDYPEHFKLIAEARRVLDEPIKAESQGSTSR